MVCARVPRPTAAGSTPALPPPAPAAPECRDPAPLPGVPLRHRRCPDAQLGRLAPLCRAHHLVTPHRPAAPRSVSRDINTPRLLGLRRFMPPGCGMRRLSRFRPQLPYRKTIDVPRRFPTREKFQPTDQASREVGVRRSVPDSGRQSPPMNGQLRMSCSCRVDETEGVRPDGSSSSPCVGSRLTPFVDEHGTPGRRGLSWGRPCAFAGSPSAGRSWRCCSCRWCP